MSEAFIYYTIKYTYIRFSVSRFVILHRLVRIVFKISAATFVLAACSLATVIALFSAILVSGRRGAVRFIFLRLKNRRVKVLIRR